jgi:GntR family phosphonate transport system transcriptional regulator
VLEYRVQKRTRFSQNVLGQNRKPGAKLLEGLTTAASKTVASALELPDGAPVVRLRVVSEADGRPVDLTDHYFSSERFPGLIAAYAETRSITAALKACGLADYVRKVTRVSARMPDREEAQLLDQAANRPILLSESINVDLEGHPVEYGICRFSSDRVQLIFEP